MQMLLSPAHSLDHQEIFQIFKSPTPGAGFIKLKGTETTPFDWPEQSYFRFELDNTGMGTVILNVDNIITTSTGFSLGTTELLLQGDNVNQVTMDSMNIEDPIGTTAKTIVPSGTFAGTVFPTSKHGPFFIETRDDVSAIAKESYELRDMVQLFTAVDVTSDPHNVKLRTYSHGIISEA